MTEETKRKISQSLRGHPVSKLSRLRMSEAAKKNGSGFKPGHKLSPEAIEKARVKKLGKSPWNKGLPKEKQPGWKGGLTPLHSRIRGSTEYKLWRRAVFERDGYTCIWCGSKDKLHTDHIKPFALFPELRFAIDNGRTLCFKCHLTTDTFAGRTNKKH